MRKTPQKYRPSVILQEGRRLQSLLLRQRQLERDLALALAAEWQSSVEALVTDLAAADKVPGSA
jgi:hypothetical protein